MADGERRSYQDTAFEVDGVRHATLEALTFYAEDGVHPEKILLRIAPGGWCSLFIDALVAHWDPLSAEQLADAREDYDGIESVDLADRLGIRGSTVFKIVADHNPGSGTVVSVHLDRGRLTFREADTEAPTQFHWTEGAT